VDEEEINEPRRVDSMILKFLTFDKKSAGLGP
jgi:hypothetical protein